MPIVINTAQKKQPPQLPNDGDTDFSEKSTEKAPKWVTSLIEVAIIILAIVLALVVRSSIYDVAIVTSRSMEPTLLVGDRIVFDHRKSLHGTWQHGDIVFFDPPETWSTDDPSVLVKRVAALPGETIEIREGQVFVNGQAQESPFKGETDDFIPSYKLQKGEYFVLGDNRNNSDDSRSHGPITGADIRGRATLRVWPSSRFGRIN